MPGAPTPNPHDPGALPRNIAHFARALRRAGLPIGPGRVVDAIRAVEAAGFTSRGDFYHTLSACFVSRPEHRAVFGQVFRLFWRDPQFLEHMMAMLLPAVRGVQEDKAAEAGERRAAEALLGESLPLMPETEEPAPEIEIDARATASGEERLKTLDFELMSNDEIAEAKRMLAKLDLPVKPMATRRGAPDVRGRLIDARGPCARRCAGVARCSGSLSVPRGRAGRTSWCFATSRARCRPIRGWSCISSMPLPTARARAGRASMPSPSARG